MSKGKFQIVELALLSFHLQTTSGRSLGNLTFPHLLWGKSSMFLEISTEEAHIGEMILPRHLLDALRSALELHLELEDDILVDNGLGGVARHLANNIREVLRGDIHLFSVVIHIPRNLEVSLHQHHEAIEEFPYPIRFYLVGTILWIALQVFVKTDEESLQLAKYQLGDTGTFRLIEIYLQQGKHSIDDVRHHRRILAAAIFSQGGIYCLLQLQACLTKQGRVILEDFKQKWRTKSEE